MNMVIVTLNCGREGRRKHYDMEIPCGVPVQILIQHICETLYAYSGGRLDLASGKLSLYCPRLDRTLQANETFESAGIWNGDYMDLK